MSFSVRSRGSELTASPGFQFLGSFHLQLADPARTQLSRVRTQGLPKEGPPPGPAGGAALAASRSAVRGDLLAPWSFSFQTREQLQADLLRCQAKIEDLEKLLVEKGQVSRTGHVLWASLRFCPLGGVPGASALRGPPHGSAPFAPEASGDGAWQARGESTPAGEPPCGAVEAQNGLGDADPALPPFAKCTKPGGNSTSKG